MARRISIAVLTGLLVLVAAGCGSSAVVPAGLTISYPGLQTGQPPWPAEYKHLAQRLRKLGLPPGGSEKFHHHALLHIYVDGLLVPLAANIGLDPPKASSRACIPTTTPASSTWELRTRTNYTLATSSRCGA